MISRNSTYVRFVSLLLIAVTFWATLLPATLVIAEGEEPAPAPAPEVVIETTTPETVVTETQTETPPTETSTQPDPTEIPGEDGADGADGAPQETPPPAEPGENGADQTPTTPAENGGDGGNGAAGGTDEPVSDGEGSVIETGDASAGATGHTSANTTDATVTPGSTDASTAENQETNVEIGNELAMENAAASDAETGENEGVDPDGVSIKTGDSEAFAYLISLFNIAITNSTGSILFLRNPMGEALNLTDRIMAVFMNLFGTNGDCSFVSCTLSDAILNFLSDSTAEVKNSVVVRSGTGENTGIAEDGDALIETGKATAFGSIVNFGNLQIVDSRYLVILMTNVGDLVGDIVLPEPEFFKSLSSGAAIAKGSNAVFENTADITNLGTTTAETGANTAEAEDGPSIGTGNARATTAEMNFVNQLGAPICFVVATGGDWHGRIHGLPEGFSRESAPFGELICGRGGAERDSYTQLNGTTTNYAKILNEAIVEAVSGKNIAQGVQAAIRSGDADAFTQILNVVNQQIIGQDWIFALFTISGDWEGDLVFGSAPTDTNPLNDVAAQLLASAAASSGGGEYGGNSGGYTSKAKLDITKTASVNETTTPATVDYTVVVKNVGEGAVYRAKLSDMLTSESGEVVYARTWNLNTIAHGEEIKLTYSVEFNEGIEAGKYTNTARVVGNLNSSIYVYPIPVNPTEATATVTILGDAPAEEKIALAPAEQCVPLIQSYIRAGSTSNDPTDVKNLQKFLKNVENEALDDNGIYDVITIAAVKRFQMKYASEILTPWGISEPTGHVYYTTQNKINNLACTGNESFDMSDDQRREIDGFRARVSQIPPQADAVSEGIGANDAEDVGTAITKGPSPVGAQVLLKSLTPAQPAAAAAAEPISSAFNPFKAVSWLKAFVPFVEALEL